MSRIDPNGKHLVEEFRKHPLGHHSAELQRLLNRLRWEPMKDKYVLVCTKPHREWTLAQLPGVRGQPVKLLKDHVFHSLKEAEWAVFKLRWKKHTGEELD